MDVQEDMVMMRNGKMLVIQNGETMPLDKELTMSDGTKVMPNGQVLMQDGMARMMVEGETMILTRPTTVDAEHLPDRDFKEAMEDEELRDQMGEDE